MLSAAVVSTDWSSRFGSRYTLPQTGGKDLAGTALVLGIKKLF